MLRKLLILLSGEWNWNHGGTVKRKGIVMKALAFKVGGRTYCCSCSYRLANVTGFPHLFFATNRPSKVNAEAVCPRCGNYYGDPISQDAAVRIAAIVMGTEPTTAGCNWNRGGTEPRGRNEAILLEIQNFLTGYEVDIQNKSR